MYRTGIWSHVVTYVVDLVLVLSPSIAAYLLEKNIPAKFHPNPT